jgi:hypothetical protein
MILFHMILFLVWPGLVCETTRNEIQLLRSRSSIAHFHNGVSAADENGCLLRSASLAVIHFISSAPNFTTGEV